MKKAFYRLVKMYHPDRPDGDEEKYREVVRAYHELTLFTPKRNLGSYTREGYNDLQAKANRKKRNQMYHSRLNRLLVQATIHGDTEALVVLKEAIEKFNEII